MIDELALRYLVVAILAALTIVCVGDLIREAWRRREVR